MREFRPADWNWDPFAKLCERCDTVIGRFGVMADADGTRHVLWWPQLEWSGIEGSYRCRQHMPIPQL